MNIKSIKEYLKKDHKECDELLIQLENATLEKNKDNITVFTKKFIDRMDRHFRIEEELLFPEFEKKTGNYMGPTQIMRMEHQDMRFQMKELESLSKKLQTASQLQEMITNLQNTLESLLYLLQQHNLKEEQILYPMMDQFLNTQKEEILKHIQRYK